MAVAGGAPAPRCGVLRLRACGRRHRRQPRAGAGRQGRAPGALRGGADRPASAGGEPAEGGGAARESRRDRREPEARPQPARGVQARRHQAALSRLAGSDELLRALGIAGGAVPARSARRGERALPLLGPLVRRAPGAQPPAGLPGRLPRARSGLSAARRLRRRRHRGRGAGRAARRAGAAHGARPGAGWRRRSAECGRRSAAGAAQPASRGGVGGDPGDGAAPRQGAARARSTRRAGRADAPEVPAVRPQRARARALGPPSDPAPARATGAVPR